VFSKDGLQLVQEKIRCFLQSIKEGEKSRKGEDEARGMRKEEKKGLTTTN